MFKELLSSQNILYHHIEAYHGGVGHIIITQIMSIFPGLLRNEKKQQHTMQSINMLYLFIGLKMDRPVS